MANEAIVSQFDNFPKKLDRLVELIYEQIDLGKKPRALENSPFVDEIEKLVFERIGLKIKINTTHGFAGILTQNFNKNHIFTSSELHGLVRISEVEKIIRSGNATGTVNLKEARLGGIFSEYSHPFFANFHHFKTLNLSAEEVTAFLLHEIGHGFMESYYSSRLNTTNQVLADITRHLLSNDQEKSLEYVYSNLKKITPEIKQEEVDRLLNGTKVISSMAWFNVFKETVSSLMTNSFYDQTSSEERADQFVTRFGRGKEVVTGLNKLFNGMPETNKAALFAEHYSSLYGLARLFIVMGISFFGFSSKVFFVSLLPLFLLAFLLEFFFNRSSLKDMTYDGLKVRYIRIRNDFVNQLKAKNLPDIHIRHFLDSIYAIDEIVKKTYELKTLPSVVADFIFLDARATQKAYTNQRLLEELSSNELFIHSAELRLA
jgi:hypothetical protein